MGQRIGVVNVGAKHRRDDRGSGLIEGRHIARQRIIGFVGQGEDKAILGQGEFRGVALINPPLANIGNARVGPVDV
ncbi:hypothetical protein D3C75_322010 [compost metagenome]